MTPTEKRQAQRDRYAARAAVQTQRDEGELARILFAIREEDYAGNFTEDQQDALARMFKRIMG